MSMSVWVVLRDNLDKVNRRIRHENPNSARVHTASPKIEVYPFIHYSLTHFLIKLFWLSSSIIPH
jgi:membrane associated rhomboid family serine protease